MAVEISPINPLSNENVGTWLASEEKREQGVSQWELDFTSEIEKIEHELRGDKWNQEKKKYETTVIEYRDVNNNLIKTEEPYRIMSEYGIQIIRKRLSFINRNTMLGNLDDKQVKQMSLFFEIHLIAQMTMDFEDFGVKLENFQTVVEMISNPVRMALTRAMFQGEKNYRSSSERRIISTSNVGDQKKPGIISRLVGAI